METDPWCAMCGKSVLAGRVKAYRYVARRKGKRPALDAVFNCPPFLLCKNCRKDIPKRATLKKANAAQVALND